MHCQSGGPEEEMGYREYCVWHMEDLGMRYQSPKPRHRPRREFLDRNRHQSVFQLRLAMEDPSWLTPQYFHAALSVLEVFKALVTSFECVTSQKCAHFRQPTGFLVIISIRVSRNLSWASTVYQSVLPCGNRLLSKLPKIVRPIIPTFLCHPPLPLLLLLGN